MEQGTQAAPMLGHCGSRRAGDDRMTEIPQYATGKTNPPLYVMIAAHSNRRVELLFSISDAHGRQFWYLQQTA
jgi:hypothetical protein